MLLLPSNAVFSCIKCSQISCSCEMPSGLFLLLSWETSYLKLITDLNYSVPNESTLNTNSQCRNMFPYLGRWAQEQIHKPRLPTLQFICHHLFSYCFGCYQFCLLFLWLFRLVTCSWWSKSCSQLTKNWRQDSLDVAPRTLQGRKHWKY